MKTLTKTQLARKLRLLPDDTRPRYVHCYDNGGKTADRYTIVFTGRYTHKTGGAHWYVGSSGAPTHPQGVYMRGESPTPVDYPRYAHLGKKVTFASLPAAVRQCVLQDYTYLWDLDGNN